MDRIRGESVTVDPERHDDDHPDRGGRVGGEAVGAPGQQSDRGDRKREPATIGGILAALLGSGRKVIEPVERGGTTLPDSDQWAVDPESAIVNVGKLVDRLIERLPSRVEIAPSEEISSMQTYLQTGVTTQIVGRQPDRVRLQITYRTDEVTAPAVYIGGFGVTTGNGREITQNETVILDTRAPVYAIADASGARLDVLIEIGDR